MLLLMTKKALHRFSGAKALFVSVVPNLSGYYVFVDLLYRCATNLKNPKSKTRSLGNVRLNIRFRPRPSSILAYLSK